jgi:hypothetical protein
VRAVGVHLHDDVVALVLGPGEPGHVRGAEALLAGPVQHEDVVVGGGQLVGDPPVPSGELSSATRMSTDGTDRRTRSVISRDVLRLVVGRDDHEDAYPIPG